MCAAAPSNVAPSIFEHVKLPLLSLPYRKCNTKKDAAFSHILLFRSSILPAQVPPALFTDPEGIIPTQRPQAFPACVPLLTDMRDQDLIDPRSAVLLFRMQPFEIHFISESPGEGIIQIQFLAIQLETVQRIISQHRRRDRTIPPRKRLAVLEKTLQQLFAFLLERDRRCAQAFRFR